MNFSEKAIKYYILEFYVLVSEKYKLINCRNIIIFNEIVIGCLNFFKHPITIKNYSLINFVVCLPVFTK